jgi:gliding-associated putative ABC transporter substrate-binding component GldG
MVNWKSRKTGDFLLLANAVVLVLLVNLVASRYFFRVDLTEEKRYSIKPQTKAILRALEDDVYIEVYLEGELNAGFRRFQKTIRETLDEFRVYAPGKLHITFTNPQAAGSEKAQSEFMADLAQRGIQPTNVIDTRDGQRVEKIIFPGAVIAAGGMETGVMLLKGSTARTSDERINQSIETVEYELIHALYTLTNTDRKRIGFLRGHGEADSMQVVSLYRDLGQVYEVERGVSLATTPSPETYDALVMVRPVTAFSEQEKYRLDQYIMQGGKVLFLIDRLNARMDSAAVAGYLALPYAENLDDQLFKYGVRINPDLVQDLQAAQYPIVTGQAGGKPQMQMMEWPFFPLINRYADHPITRNLDAVVARFISSIDTVKAPGVKKTPLLFTSAQTRTVMAPVNISANALRQDVRPEDFSKDGVPVGYLLEGSFTSLYKNRFLPDGETKETFRDHSVPTRLVVLADADLAINEVNQRNHQPQPLGFYPFTNYIFANRDLLMNAVAYLVDEQGLIQARSKQIKIRPLDREKVKQERVTWQFLNLVVPLVLLTIFGVVRMYWRKKKFARFG